MQLTAAARPRRYGAQQTQSKLTLIVDPSTKSLPRSRSLRGLAGIPRAILTGRRERNDLPQRLERSSGGNVARSATSDPENNRPHSVAPIAIAAPDRRGNRAKGRPAAGRFKSPVECGSDHSRGGLSAAALLPGES